MAEKRMFSKKITNSDKFLSLPLSTQALYFHLNMNADDDGFVNNPKMIQRMVGCQEDELALLIAKRFILVFESGIIVIKHWRIHNYIQNDRYHETQYLEEKGRLVLKENKAYTEAFPVDKGKCIQDGYKLDTENRLDKNRLDKKRIVKNKYGEFNNVLLTEDEFEKLKEKYPHSYESKIEKLSIYVESTGKSYKSHYATILNWARKEEPSKKVKENKAIQQELKGESMPEEIRTKLEGMFSMEKGE